ncbi:MAG: GNAT family N-acetyltransferase [Bacteroidota bacterium]
MPVIKAVLADVPQLNVLVNSAYRGETSKQGWTTEADLLDGMRIDEEMLTSYFNDDNVIILKNTDENGVINGCVYLEVRRPRLYVGMFSVSPVLQGKGIGRDLLLAAEEQAKQLDIHTLSMTVISIRHELIDWYKRRGYHPTGEMLPFHPGEKFGTARRHLELAVLKKSI